MAANINPLIIERLDNHQKTEVNDTLVINSTATQVIPSTNPERKIIPAKIEIRSIFFPQIISTQTAPNGSTRLVTKKKPSSIGVIVDPEIRILSSTIPNTVEVMNNNGTKILSGNAVHVKAFLETPIIGSGPTLGFKKPDNSKVVIGYSEVKIYQKP